MSSLINTPGRELNRLMGQLGYPEQLGDLCGSALDKAISGDPGLASNLLDVFSSMVPSQLGPDTQQSNMSESGYCRPPQDIIGESRNRFGGTYYQREKIHTYNIGKDSSLVTIGGKFVDIGPKTTPADFEKRILTEPAFRRQIEKQLGGRIILDGNADGKVRVAKREALPEMRNPNPSRILKNLMQRVRDLLTGMPQSRSTAAPILPNPIVRDHRSESVPILPNPIVRDHRTESVPTLPNPIVRDHRSEPVPILPNPIVRDHRSEPVPILPNPIVRDHRTSAPPAGANQVLENLTKYMQATSPNTDAAPASNGDDLSAILHDPSLSFEQKLAMFMFAFLDKKGKELEQKMDDMQKKSKQPNGAGTATGAEGQAGNTTDGSSTTGGSSGSGNGAGSNQIDTMKLNQEVQDLNKMFTLVDNMLKSMNDAVKQGPLASIRG